MSYTVGSLFAGYGGLEMGVGMVLPTELRWYSEIDPAAIRVMEHHHPGIPNLGDITEVDWSQVEPVDIATGGFPCQDVSAAGRGAGLNPDTRSGLWAQMAKAIAALQPGLVIVENVRGLLHAEAASAMEPCPWCVGNGPDSGLRALGAVLGDLADLGFDAEWCVRRASDDGAPHQRARVFIAAAHAGRVGIQRRSVGRGVPGAESAGTGEGLQRQRRRDTLGDGGTTAADTGGEAGRVGAGLRTAGQPGAERRPRPHDSTVAVADTGRAGRQGNVDEKAAATGGRVDEHGRRDAEQPIAGCGEPVAADTESIRRGERWTQPDRGGETGSVVDSDHWGVYTPAIRRWETILERGVPTPVVLGARGGNALSAHLVEWMMGLPDGHLTAVPHVSRQDAIKLGGNGVVPVQTASAVRFLLTRLFGTEGIAA